MFAGPGSRTEIDTASTYLRYGSERSDSIVALAIDGLGRFRSRGPPPVDMKPCPKTAASSPEGAGGSVSSVLTEWLSPSPAEPAQVQLHTRTGAYMPALDTYDAGHDPFRLQAARQKDTHDEQLLTSHGACACVLFRAARTHAYYARSTLTLTLSLTLTLALTLTLTHQTFYVSRASVLPCAEGQSTSNWSVTKNIIDEWKRLLILIFELFVAVLGITCQRRISVPVETDTAGR